MRRIMIAGTNSGCGKTTVTCAVLQALVNRKINVSSFKCGPDYIDPMFHKTVIGTAAYNLDTYLMSNDTVNYLLNKNSGDIAVIEGVMGFYDGFSFTEKGSTHEFSEITDTDVILVVNCRGMSLSAMALVKCTHSPGGGGVVKSACSSARNSGSAKSETAQIGSAEKSSGAVRSSRRANFSMAQVFRMR